MLPLHTLIKQLSILLALPTKQSHCLFSRYFNPIKNNNLIIHPLTSGLTNLVEKMEWYNHAGIIHINGIEHFPLAAITEEN